MHIEALIFTPKLAAGLIAWAMFSAVVDGMPKPDANSTTLYRWTHASLNLVAGNVFRVFCALSPIFRIVFGKQTEQPANVG